VFKYNNRLYADVSAKENNGERINYEDMPHYIQEEFGERGAGKFEQLYPDFDTDW
jgi:hypothetical protein